MAVKGTFPIAQGPLLSNEIGQAATQVQQSGTPPIANRTITTPTDNLGVGGTTALTFVGPNVTLTFAPSMQDPSAILAYLNNNGVTASILVDGTLYLSNVTSVTGDTNTQKFLGLQ